MDKLENVFAKRETRKIGEGCGISYKNSVYVPDDGGRTHLEAKSAETVKGESEHRRKTDSH
jgi:hypothetical protein